MIEVKIGMHKVLLYDSIENLPMYRYNKFNKFMIMDANVGSDINKIDGFISDLLLRIKHKDPQVSDAIMNLRQTFFLIANEISPKFLSFAALVHSINGERVKDDTDDGLKSVCEKLGNKVSVGTVNDEIEKVRKK